MNSLLTVFEFLSAQEKNKGMIQIYHDKLLKKFFIAMLPYFLGH